MNTNTTTTNEQGKQSEQPQLTAAAIKAIGRDVASFTEQATSSQREAFVNICRHADGLVDNVSEAYAALNAVENAGKTTHKDISASRFADLFMASAAVLKIDVKASKSDVRNLVVYANNGTDEALREHFLLVVSETGAFPITFAGYLNYLSKRDHFTPSGRLSKVGKEAAAAQAAERAQREALKAAARTARPLSFDWSTAYVSNEGGDPNDKQSYLVWLMTMQVELTGAIDAARKNLSKDELAQVRTAHYDKVVASAQ